MFTEFKGDSRNVKRMKSLLNFILPSRCAVTGEITPDVCGLSVDGFKRLRFIVPPVCNDCGAPLKFSQEACEECGDSVYAFDGARCVLEYNETVKRLILDYKNKDKLSLTPLFTQWLITYGRDVLKEADYIVPVPLPLKRLRTRMYNQAAELVKSVSKRMNKPCVLDAIINVSTKEQKSLERRVERFNNMQNAFKPNVKYEGVFNGKTLLIIDDVMTTGATLNGCAEALKQFNPKKIMTLTIGKVLKNKVL